MSEERRKLFHAVNECLKIFRNYWRRVRAKFTYFRQLRCFYKRRDNAASGESKADEKNEHRSQEKQHYNRRGFRHSFFQISSCIGSAIQSFFFVHNITSIFVIYTSIRCCEDIQLVTIAFLFYSYIILSVKQTLVKDADGLSEKYMDQSPLT